VPGNINAWEMSPHGQRASLEGDPDHGWVLPPVAAPCWFAMRRRYLLMAFTSSSPSLILVSGYIFIYFLFSGLFV